MWSLMLENAMFTLMTFLSHCPCLVTVASNRLTDEPSQKCKCYTRAKKAQVDGTQPNLVREHNSYMGGIDQLDSYLKNLRSCTESKKWYWAQLIDMVHVFQVTSYRFYCHLQPGKRVLQLDILCNILHHM